MARKFTYHFGDNDGKDGDDDDSDKQADPLLSASTLRIGDGNIDLGFAFVKLGVSNLSVLLDHIDDLCLLCHQCLHVNKQLVQFLLQLKAGC